MRSGVVALGLVGAALAGCGFHRAGLADGGVDDGSGGVSDSCMTFASLLDTCQLAFDKNLTITGAATYDSTTQTLMIGGGMATASITMVMIDGEPVDVISAQKVSVAASSTLRATGPRALAIVASDSLVVAADSQINVSDGGAGARTSCPGGATAGTNNADGAGGGGGGGFGADGGPGGEGDFDHGVPFVPGGAKGNAVAMMPAGLRGGCPGGNGGNGDALGGVGGGGGGAIYLVAGNLIQLDSTAPVHAGGGGGRGGVHDQSGGDAGGGGGGSGGTVILEAPHIMGTRAVIAANGGGGGEGSDAGGSTGANGTTGTVTASRASGGAGNAGGGADGGRGGSSEVPAGEVVTAVLNGGGGGGGGGVGIIRILSGDAHLPPTSPIAHTN
jgi:hypothetical protein